LLKYTNGNIWVHENTSHYDITKIINKYNIDHLIDNEFIIGEISKGIYRLPQFGWLAYDKLAKHLTIRGFTPTLHPSGLFKQQTTNVTFFLVVDDFGIKFIHQEDAQHLVDHLNKYYKTTVNWNRKLFCDMRLEWDYIDRTVVLDIPNYVKNPE